MGADNATIGSEWRGWGVRMGLVSMMAATGMVLAGHAAQATTTVTETPATQGGEGLPLDLQRLDGGNSGATCGGQGGDDGGAGGPGDGSQGGLGINALSDIGVLPTGNAAPAAG